MNDNEYGDFPPPQKQRSRVSSQKQIVSFMHCALCLAELPPDTSPADYQQLEVGFTRPGLQIWCRRHDANVAHIDFQGQRHPANLTSGKEG